MRRGWTAWACLSISVAACSRAELEYPEYTKVSGGSAGAKSTAGAGGGTSGGAGAGAKGGAAAGKAGAAGAAGAPPSVPGCVTLEVDGPPVSFEPGVVGARATTMPGDDRVVLGVWDGMFPGANVSIQVRPVFAWGSWPPAVAGAHASPFFAPVPPLLLAPGLDASTYAAVVAPVSNALIGPMITLAEVTGDGALVGSVPLANSVDIDPRAVAPTPLGHMAAYEQPPYLDLHVAKAATSLSQALPAVGCATMPMVADVAAIGGAPWVFFSTSRALNTCLLDDGVIGIPKFAQLARVDVNAGGTPTLVDLGVEPMFDDDYLTLVRVLPSAGGALVAHRYAGSNAAVQPGVSLRRADASGATLAGPVMILDPFQVRPQAMAEVKGSFAAAYVDSSTGRVVVSTHEPASGTAATASTTFDVVPGTFADVQFVIAEPNGDHLLVGWITGPPSAKPALSLARVRCLPGE